MKGHVMILADFLKEFPQFKNFGLTRYRFAEGANTKFLVMVNDIAALISDYERRVLLATYVTYFDTPLVPVVIKNK